VDRKSQANLKAVTERQELAALNREAKTKRDALAELNDKLEQATYKRDNLEKKQTSLEGRRETVRIYTFAFVGANFHTDRIARIPNQRFATWTVNSENAS
jgi:hypothetical protein